MICLIGCGAPLAENAPKYGAQSQRDLVKGMTYTVIVIDGCEYILGKYENGYGGGYTLTHKGDCKNPIHHYDTKLFK